MTIQFSPAIGPSPTHSRGRSPCLAALLTGLLCLAGGARAADDVFMKVDGVQGDSVDRDHRGEIDLLTYSQTFETKSCSEVLVTKRLDSASPQLVARAVSGLRLPSVIIAFRRGGDPLQEYFKATLQSVVIARIELSESGTEVTERVSLQPRDIRIEFRAQKADGSLGSAVITNFSCR